MKVRNKSPDLTPIIIVLSLLFIGATQITALWALTRTVYNSLIESTSVVKVQPTLAQFSTQIYGLEIADNRVLLASRIAYINATDPEVALKDALNQLFTQSEGLELITTIPQQTRLLDLHITEQGIHLNLSKDFIRGGGSSSMIYRVAQVLYTSTSLDPEASVFLSIEGQPLDENHPLGGEGLLLDYPLTRQSLRQNFSLE